MRQKWRIYGLSNMTGVRNGVSVSIAHFPIDDPRFWEVVRASGNDVHSAKMTAGEATDTLGRFVLFD
jgi:hypothetical protein